MMDAAAAIDMLEVRCLGRAKHIDTRWMWIQSSIRKGEIKLLKVHAKSNPADLTTKFLKAEEAEKHLAEMGYFYIDK